MPRKNFKVLRDQVMVRPGAAERMAVERKKLIALHSKGSEDDEPFPPRTQKAAP
ncbi:MAG: hypothetical protein HOH95_05385 [Dehalococcoidia bacterium]|jgi:hypothetical protein|nr:hypothetical protein [Dehalococcoidia bacterium]